VGAPNIQSGVQPPHSKKHDHLDIHPPPKVSSGSLRIVGLERSQGKEAKAMHLIAPDILLEARGLSVAVSATGMGLGFLLWALGWWGHRFWVVLFTTVVAGIFGLFTIRAYGIQPMVAGILLAVAAGTLALALARVVAFGAGGVAAWLAVRALAPQWQEPLVTFLAGGLVGVLLFRVWMMTLTSMGGTLLMAYSSLCLVDRLGKLDPIALAERSPAMLNWICVGMALLGLVVQFLLERWRVRNQRWREEEKHYRMERERRLRSRSWWSNWGRSYRRAG
jgi:MFS family permease